MFIVIMEGRARAANRRLEEHLYGAWHSEAFQREKRLKPLSKYLTPATSQRQTPEDMLAMLREFQSRGAAMDIKKMN